MSLLVPSVNSFAAVEYDETAPNTGTTTVTPVYSNGTKTTTWTQLAASTAFDSYALSIWAQGAFAAGVDVNFTLDFATGASSSEVAFLSNLIVEKQNSQAEHQISHYRFPVFIPAGSRLSVRGLSSHTTGSCLMRWQLHQKPSDPLAYWVGGGIQTVGTVTNTVGVSFTPGNSGAWGSYASLGTTSGICRSWELGVGCSNATMTGNLFYWHELAYGDGTNYTTILRRLCSSNSSERIYWASGYGNGAVPFNVPSGATLYVRGMCSGTAETGWHALAYGTY